jgi:hypothetical protein
MGRKAEQRQQRTAAAQARDAQIIASGQRDPLLLDWMKESRQRDPAGFHKAAAHARHQAARPSSPERVQALVALGGLQALEAEDRLAEQEPLARSSI